MLITGRAGGREFAKPRSWPTEHVDGVELPVHRGHMANSPVPERGAHPPARGPHVALLSDVVNPVACKVGPETSMDDVLELCARLDPHREPGRLTLAAKMGADLVDERLPRLVWAVRAARYPVIWLTDPMHDNTVNSKYGLKTRHVAISVHRRCCPPQTTGGCAWS